MRDFIKITKDRIEFTDSRFYELNGNFYPSVTTILDAYPKSYAFYEWVKKMGDDADEIRDEAGRKGSAVHQLCEEYDNGKPCTILNDYGEPKYKQIEWAMFERYVEFRKRYGHYLVANELHYISPDLGFAGTLDRVFIIDEKVTLVDIKTANSLHNHYWLQLAAYKKLWDEVNEKKIEQTAILWLNAKTRTDGKKGDMQGTGWQLKFPENSLGYYWNLFNGVRGLWLEENGSMKPRNTSYNLKHELNGEEIKSKTNGLQEVR